MPHLAFMSNLCPGPFMKLTHSTVNSLTGLHTSVQLANEKLNARLVTPLQLDRTRYSCRK